MNTAMKRPGSGKTLRTSILAVFIFIAILLSLRLYWIQPGSCYKPVTYHIGSIDPRFGLSNQEVEEAVRTAVSVWCKASNGELFREEPQGRLEINFVYDYRQAAADKLRKISGNIDDTKGDYDALKAHIEVLDAELKQCK